MIEESWFDIQQSLRDFSVLFNKPNRLFDSLGITVAGTWSWLHIPTYCRR